VTVAGIGTDSATDTTRQLLCSGAVRGDDALGQAADRDGLGAAIP